MSLDSAVIDLSRSFAYGMGYVALSRVRTLNGVHLLGISPNALAVDPRILAVDQQLQELSHRASNRLEEISKSELQKTHDEFILKSGGTLEAIKISKKDLKNAGKVITEKTHITTYDLIKSGKTIPEVAIERDLTQGTIINHLEKCRELGMDTKFHHVYMDGEDLHAIKNAFEHAEIRHTDAGQIKLAPIKSYLEKSGRDFTFDQIRLAKLLLGK